MRCIIMPCMFLSFISLFPVPLSAHAAPAGCHVTAEYCVEGKAERRIDGYPLTRDCWKKQTVYSCPKKGPQGACTRLSNMPVCTRTGVACLKKDKDGVCLRERNTYRCKEALSAGAASDITLLGTIRAEPERRVHTGVQCGSAFWCPTDEEGNAVCKGTASSDSPAFARAASWMGLLGQMGKEKDPDALTLFKGEGLSCSRSMLNTKNCCSEKGWLLDTLGGCSETEKKLIARHKQKTTVFIGKYCTKKLPLAGTCLKRKEVYCTFKSKFARILQVQGRAQLGIGWGTAKKPNCRSLSLADLQKLDFSRIDLSELYADMMAAAKAKSEKDTTDRVGQKIRDYYKNPPGSGSRTQAGAP